MNVSRWNLYVLFSMALLCGCEPSSSLPPSTWQTISSRDHHTPSERIPLYRAIIPPHWTRLYPSPDVSIKDTTKPNCEFLIDDTIRISIHTFPSQAFSQRIPPEAQIARWKRQFLAIEPTSLLVQEISKGGFTGLYLQASGELDNQQMTMLGYSLQLTSFYWHILRDRPNVTFKQEQMSADYTIKATGPIWAMAQHQTEIETFARHFELIEELPLQ